MADWFPQLALRLLLTAKPLDAAFEEIDSQLGLNLIGMVVVVTLFESRDLLF